MADISMTQPEGILKDVLVKVGKFIFLVDFVVIDIEEDKEIPLLLGGPFLAIGVALIEQGYCMETDSVNYVFKKMNDDLMNENSFDDYISSSLYDDNFEKEKIMVETILSLRKILAMKKNSKRKKRALKVLS